jgi:hypothetical protein
MDALTGRRFIDAPASAMVINSKPITSAQTVNEMVTASTMIEISQAPGQYPVPPVQAATGKKTPMEYFYTVHSCSPRGVIRKQRITAQSRQCPSGCLCAIAPINQK